MRTVLIDLNNRTKMQINRGMGKTFYYGYTDLITGEHIWMKEQGDAYIHLRIMDAGKMLTFYTVNDKEIVDDYDRYSMYVFERSDVFNDSNEIYTGKFPCFTSAAPAEQASLRDQYPEHFV